MKKFFIDSKKSLVLTLSLKVIVINLVAFCIGAFIVEDIIGLAKGFALGGIFTILKIKLMEVSFTKAIQKTPNKAGTYAKAHYFLRYLLTFIVLFVGILEPSINSIGVIIGLISMKIAAYWQGYIEKPTPKDGSVEFYEWEDDEEESDF